MSDDFRSGRPARFRRRSRSRRQRRVQGRRSAGSPPSLMTPSSPSSRHPSSRASLRSSPSLPPSGHRLAPFHPRDPRRLGPGSTSLTPSKSTAPSFVVPQRHHASPATVRSRLVMVWGLLILGLLGLLGNLIRLQVFQATELQQRAQDQHGVSLAPFIPRRPIIDRNGHVLAVDRQEYILYVHPIGFKENSLDYKQTVATKLAPILEQEPSVILERLNLRDSGIKLKTGLTEEDAERVRQLFIDGLELSPYQDRFYPQESLFSHIVGYVNLDRIGQVGVEYSQAEVLSHQAPILEVNRTGYGAVMPERVPEEFNYHEHLSLKLTVDSRLQRRVRSLIQQETQRLTAQRGLAIVMEVKTGAIRAMVTEPSYDPNGLHTEADIPNMVNSAVSHLYEPGSTFKPINVAIALESGRLSLTDIIHDSGRITLGTWPIENHDFKVHGGRGDLTVEEVMKHSSNVGMIRIMEKLDAEQYYDWLENLGLGEFTGVDLPFEAPALVKRREQFIESSVESATTAFGQGFSLTPLQLLQMLATIGNGGKLVTPHVVDGLFDYRDQRYWTPERPQTKPVFSEATSQLVLDMMETVVMDGTGRLAQVPGYRIAGKTGTAQKAGDRGVYIEDARVTSFVSLFPVNDPQFAILVLVDEPQGENTYGGTVAAPIAQQITESIITLENLPPANKAGE